MEITLTLNVEDVNLVITALAELPFKVSCNLIGKVRDQASAQLEPTE